MADHLGQEPTCGRSAYARGWKWPKASTGCLGSAR